MSSLYLASRMTVAPALRAIWRPTVEGRSNVPRTGGVLIASNHLSFVDSVVIPMVAPRKVFFLAKAEYFTGTGVRGAISRAWFNSMGMIPVERDDSRAAADSLETALTVLRAGKAFGIYPEGTRSRDGRLYRGHTGVAHLAMQAGVPVVPVGLHGTPDVQPIGSNRPRLAKVTVRFGEPLTFGSSYKAMPAGKARRQATDEIMAAIAGLSGQQLAGCYNERPAS
ncbi:lysophospholipid acyltransferase family protein [Rudaeicoccus suwonensis]|uniref:1-acyl-sn-glycerol-3-phosphate acyltransferase n=1 Tax=Rudaeicoccus suwonensis TaxID=657409 RepID=A0A561E391_9MICO|nr:lysophospholipid acyltransferase family protein [Rudaeicoccus suwonensis]TWE10084.1 1-acyl-sn-glycerol-3-phosphate acyltransferase [Rudaeicoccus suwonensis]